MCCSVFFFKQKTADEMRISDWISDVCSSDLKVLEPMRAGGEIGAALEAEIALKCGVSDQNWLAPLVDELRFLLISGDVSLEADDDAHEITVIASPTKKAKCVRCWHHRADVGNDAAHPQLRSEEHTSKLQSLMRISYAVFCLKKKQQNNKNEQTNTIP